MDIGGGRMEGREGRPAFRLPVFQSSNSADRILRKSYSIVKSIIKETFQELRSPSRRGEVSSPVVACFMNAEVHYKIER